jgi:hypothetical protein
LDGGVEQRLLGPPVGGLGVNLPAEIVDHLDHAVEGIGERRVSSRGSFVASSVMAWWR